MIKVGIVGCMGRMGQILVDAVLVHPDCTFGGGTEAEGSHWIGQEIGTSGQYVSDDAKSLFETVDVVIDFTVPVATCLHADIAAATGTPLIIGTTGITKQGHAHLDICAQSTVIMQSGNMSLGITLLSALTKQVAERLGTNWDIEIVEMHHRHKIDAPSGTGLILGEAAASGRGVGLDDVACKSREGNVGVRPEGEIGFATLRGGSVIGEHSVIFASENERITLSHHAENRNLFSEGALAAALWAVNKPHGRYSMQDVLGF
jgi:4-hydroxy-tetrahydrodipicolinate reductase